MIQTTFKINSSDTFFPEEKIQDQLNDWMCKGITTIAKNSFEAQASGKLDNGIWYGMDYKLALDKKNTEGAKTRYKFLKDNSGFSLGYLPVKYFTRSKPSDGKAAYRFTVKEGVSPSEAILAIVEKNIGPCIIDCGAVCQLVRYYALLKVIGKDRFNRLFTKVHGELLSTDYRDTDDQPMRYFVAFTENAKQGKTGKNGKRPVQPGQVVSFQNHPKYGLKHPAGMDSSFNLVCTTDDSGKQCFTGHGVLFLDENEMNQHLQSQFNKETDDISVLVPENLALQEKMVYTSSKEHQKLQIKIEEISGYDPNSPQSFNAKLVYDLMDIPLEKLKMEFVKKHPEAQASLKVIQQLKGSRVLEAGILELNKSYPDSEKITQQILSSVNEKTKSYVLTDDVEIATFALDILKKSIIDIQMSKKNKSKIINNAILDLQKACEKSTH